MTAKTDVEAAREQLRDAYERGCIDTHKSIQAEPELALMHVDDAEFGEAADDYASSVILTDTQASGGREEADTILREDENGKLREVAPVPAGDVAALVERLAGYTEDCHFHVDLQRDLKAAAHALSAPPLGEGLRDRWQDLRVALMARAYVTSENHLTGGRVTIGFEKLADAQVAHEAIGRLPR